MSSWRDRHLGVVGVVSIVALLGVTLLVGCGGGSSPAGSAGSNQTAAPSGGPTSTVAGTSAGASNTASTAHPGNVPTQSTSTPSTKAPASSSTQAVSPPVGGRLLRRFAGSGNTRLGTIVVSSPAVLVWRAQHPAIQIFTAKGFMLVSSHASSGSIQLSRGTYPGMRVASRARWSIELRARS